MQTLDPKSIYPDPLNLREAIDFDHVRDLAERMKQHGFREKNAIEVRKVDARRWHDQLAKSPRQHEPDWKRSVNPERVPRQGEIWQVVDGEHRLHAARLANLPAVYVHISTLNDDEALRNQIEGNTGSAWSPREWMAALKRLREQGKSFEEAKSLLGKNQTWMESRWEAAILPDEVLQHLGNGLSIEALKSLTDIYQLVGKSKHIKSVDDARRVVLDIIQTWVKREKPAGLVTTLANNWLVEARQFTLTGESPVPTDVELTERQAAAALSRFKRTATELVTGVKSAFATWRRLYPDAPAQDFFRAAGAVSSTRISALLDELGLIETTARETACGLCAAADKDNLPEICRLCSIQPANRVQSSEFSVQGEGPKGENMSKKRRKKHRMPPRNKDGSFRRRKGARRKAKSSAKRAAAKRTKKPYRVIRIAKGAKLVREPGVLRLYRA